MPNMPDLLIAGVPAVLVVVALVAVAKRYFALTARGAATLALVLGPLLSIGTWASVRWPTFGDFWQALMLGLIVSLVAMGGFSGGKALAGK